MTSGEVKFTVDGVECPDTSGVGVGAIGGAFNCGLSGNIFRIYCSTLCEPNFAVHEIKLWKASIVSLNGTPYQFAGGTTCTHGYATDMKKVFETGSYLDDTCYDCYSTLFAGEKGTATHSTLNLQLEQRSHITQVVTLTQAWIHPKYRLTLDTKTIEDKNTPTTIYTSGSGNIPIYLVVSGSWYATDFGTRCNDNIDHIHWAKIIILGTVCTDDNEDLSLDLDTWSAPSTFAPTLVGESLTFSAPTYISCGEVKALTDLSFEFFDVHQLYTDQPLDWITIDAAAGTITVSPTI